MACNDSRGQHVLDACRILGVTVLEQVAVVGVDNTETVCEHSNNSSKIWNGATSFASGLSGNKPTFRLVD